MKKILILLLILLTNNAFANQEEIKKMVFKSESYNLGLNKKDTTIQGIKLKPITKIEAFKHSVKKNYGWTEYGIKVVKSSDGLPVRHGDTSIRFELHYDDCGFLYKNGKERDCIRSTPHHRVELGQGHNKDISLGYSTHEDPNNVVAAGIALGLGATTFEKHVAVKTSVYGVNDYSATPEQINLWLSSILKSSEMIGIKNKKAENSKEEITSLKALQRGAFAKRDLSSGTKITLEDLEFCIPVQEDGYTANDFSKYTEFVSKTHIKKMDSINISNTEVKNLRNDILDIVKQIRSFVDNENIVIPNGEIMEISHHYGLESFKKFGLVMFTIVNEEYCKKLLYETFQRTINPNDKKQNPNDNDCFIEIFPEAIGLFLFSGCILSNSISKISLMM